MSLIAFILNKNLSHYRIIHNIIMKTGSREHGGNSTKHQTIPASLAIL